MYKQYLTTKNILLLLLAIFVIAIAFRFFSILSFPDSSVVLEKGELLQINNKETYNQTFVANRNNLNRIQFLMRTPGIKAGDTVNVKLADETCSTSLRQGTLQFSFLNSDNLYVFDFPAVKDSLGKKYCAILSYQSKISKDKYLRFFTTANTNGAMTLTFADTKEEKKNQSLSMRLVYKNDSIWGDLNELNQRMSQYKPWFLKHFYIAFIGLFFVLSSLVLIIALIELKMEKKEE